MKVFMEMTQARDQLGPQERLLKARTPETCSGKSHMDCYHFCQQCEDYFETSGATGMNHTPFAATFLRGAISLRWAQNKQTPVTGDNTEGQKKKKKRHDPSKVTCFNCNKIGYYAYDCTEPPKN